jgi:hypothetical protein
MSDAHGNLHVATIELAKRELARRNLIDYVKYMFENSYHRPFNENWHHGYICEILTAFDAGEITRMIIEEPPSYTKTELCVRQFVPWSLGQDPQKKFIYGTYGDTLSTMVSNETRNNVESKAYHNLFPNVTLDRNQNQKDHWTTTDGGRFYATSTSAAVTGIHCDRFLLDDPLKATEAHSASARDSVYNFFTGSVLTRLRDKKRGGIGLIAQRIHPDDLTGRLLKENPELWTHVKLQALNAQRQYYAFGKFSYEREANEPLWIAYEDSDDLEKAKKEMGYNFDVQYQQDPAISEYGFFVKEDWTWINDFDIPEQNKYIMVDPAMSLKETSDNRAITCNGLSIDANKQELLITYDYDYGKWDLETFVEYIIGMMVDHPTAPVFLESQGGGILVEQALRKEILKRNAKARSIGLPLITNSITLYNAPNNISKNQKIMALQTYYHTSAWKFRRTGRGMEQFQKETWRWRPDIAHNDDNGIDTVASVLLLDGKLTAPKNTKALEQRVDRFKPKKTWRI